jgi:hypothetical protein
MSQQQPDTSHFDAAKSIVEALKALDKPSQILALRFASETLGLQPTGSAPPPAGIAASAQPAVVAGVPAASQPHVQGTTHSTDIKQFTALKAPKTDQQFAAVAAYFYRFEAPEAQRKDAVDADALREAARLAGRKQAKNWLFTLRNAKVSGLFDSSGTGQYVINSVGENLVAMALPENNSEDKPKRASKKKQAKKASKKKAAKKKTA